MISDHQRTYLEQRGSALMTSLAILFLLVTIALIMVRISGTEQQSSTRNVHQTRAEFLARSGLEHVINKELTGRQGVYTGEDWNADWKNTEEVKAGKTEKQLGNNDEYLNYRVSPKFALRPSFFVDARGDEKPDGNPALIRIREGGTTRYRGYSGELPSSVRGGREIYSTSVIDNNAKLNINSLNANMGKMIDILYQEITGKQKTPGTDRIMPERPDVSIDPQTRNIQGGYPDVSALRERGILSASVYDLLRPYLTVQSQTWVDTSVIRPTPQPKSTAGKHPPTNAKTAFPYNFDYPPQPRAPLNVNRAVKPLLVAALTNISARVIGVHQISRKTKGKAIHKTFSLGAISREEARQIAEAMIQYRRGELPIIFRGDTKHRGPFRTWEEFEAFVDQELVTEGIISRAKGYMLKAHFNPNTRFSKENPNQARVLSWKKGNYRMFIDKTDFSYHTTEFTFYSGGYYTVTSHGRILGPDHEVMAESTVRSLIRKHRILRHTTQQEFLTSSVEQRTYRVQTHPDAMDKRIRDQSKQGSIPGSTKDGGITLEEQSAYVGHHYWNFNKPDHMSTADQAPRYMSDTLPYAWQSREANDVGRFIEQGEKKTGEIGTTLKRYFDRYPNVDPFLFSDVVPDGLLMGSDRNRLIRFPTDESSFPAISWRQGHLEFWWKPKQSISTTDHSTEKEEANSQKKQYLSNGFHFTLFEQWFLARNARIQIPYYENATYCTKSTSHMCDDSVDWDQHLWTLEVTEDTSVKFQQYNVPQDVKFIQGTKGNAAGYFMDFWFQDGTWYFLIRFRSVFNADEISGWEGTPRETIKAGDLLGGAVLAEMPAKGKTHPKPGQWNHIVLQWQPERHSFRYYDGLQTTKRKKRLLGGTFWINGEKAESKTYWGEGNLVGDDNVFVSNIGIASNEQRMTMGEQHFGWPPTWYRENLHFPTHLGPQRLDKYPSYGHIGARVRKRGPQGRSAASLWPESPYTYEPWWHTFAEGTIDSAYISGNPDRANEGAGVVESRYYKESSWRKTPHFAGRLRQESDPYYRSGPPKRKQYSNVKQRVLRTQKSSRIEILGLAHTQYTPKKDYDGSKIPPSLQPFFQLYLQKGDKFFATPIDWRGAYLPTEEFLKEKQCTFLFTEKDPYIVYRLQAKNASRAPMNVTPYFDDLTVFYRLKSDQLIQKMHTVEPARN